MDILKKAGIMGGAVIGGVVGGTFSVVGEISKVKILDEIGASIIDSSITTGAIAGDLASGTTDIVVGKLAKNPKRIYRGKKDLKCGGGKIINNFCENLKLTIDNGGEIIKGVKAADKERTLTGVKTFAKMAAVGFITTGAVKVSADGVKSSRAKNINTESDMDE